MHTRNQFLWMIILTISMILCMLPRAHSQNGGQVTVTADPEVICAGDSSTLHAEATVSSPIIDFETGDFSQYEFVNNNTYPWIVVTADNGSTYCIKSGNGGHHNTISSISATHSFSKEGHILFSFFSRGEGSDSYDWDNSRFYIDGVLQFRYGKHTSWESYVGTVSAGTHTFIWEYKKDGSTHPEGDAFFVDNIIFTTQDLQVEQYSIDFETQNLNQYSFVNDGTYPWSVVHEGFGGSYCMKSGNGGHHSTTSSISATAEFFNNGSISFKAKCMGEGTNWDKCIFYIDNVQQFSYGNNVSGWNDYNYTVPPGSHTFKWSYSKDYSTHPPGDAFFVDDITFVYGVSPPSGTPSEATFTWTPGNLHGPDVTVYPTETTTYTVMATDESGTIIGTANQTVVVYQDPELSISTNTGSANICEGDTIVLYVTVGGLKDVKVGDILCTDGTTVPPSQWPCEKTAKGIVFYVDATGQHGWAVDLGEITETKQWSTASQNISGLQNHDSFMDAIADLDGYNNTQAVRSAGNASNYPAAYAVDFSNGWYLPSAGQLNILYGEYFAVNTSLELVGGLLINSQNNAFLWSSSAASSNQVWIVTVDKGFFQKEPKTSKKKIRAVIDF